MNKEKLKKEIFRKVKNYYKIAFKKKFIPGKTLISASGKVFDEKEMVSLTDSVLDFWLTEGKFTREFEHKFSNYLKIPYAILTNSGSSANLLAFLALTSPELGKRRIKPGDEVIAVAAAFPTTVNPIIQLGCVPVFVDIDLETLNIDSSKIEKAITKKTKAIFLAHSLGNPFDLKTVLKVAKKYNLFVIEDTCDALGSTYNGQLVGTFGDIGTFSFYPAHQMSCAKNTPIPYLDENGKWKLDKIEKIYEKYVNSPNKIRILSFNKNNKIEWSIPSAIIRHRLGAKKMVKITCQHGREVEITEDHSVFILDKDEAAIIPKFTKEIKKNDYLVATNNIPCPSEIKHIDILDCFGDRNAYVSNFSYSNLRYVKNADYRWQFKSRNTLPIKYLKEYNLETEDLKVGISQSHKIPARIPVNEDLCRLVGYFLAEGSYRNGLIFSFNENEQDLVKDVNYISKSLFNFPPSITKMKNTAVNVEVQSKNLEIIFKEKFGIEGSAYTKRIPWFLYHCNENCIYSFVYGYTRGDGSIKKMKDNTNRIDVTSVSKELLNDFQYLLSRIRISASFYRRNIAKKYKIGKFDTVRKENYSLCFSGYIYKNKSLEKQNLKDRNNISVQIPLLPVFRKYICVGKKQKIMSRTRLKKYLGSNKKLYSLVNNDLCFLKVRSIQEVPYKEGEYMYDISIPGKENFYGGFLGLFLHNTMGEGGAVLTNNPLLKKIIRSFRDWGRDCWCEPGHDNTCGKRFGWQLGKLPLGYDHKYTYSHLGYNFKVTDLQSAIGVAQIEKLPEFIEARRKNFQFLYEGLKKYKDYFIFARPTRSSKPCWFGFPITLREKIGFDRAEIINYLEKNKIMTRMLFCGNITRQPYFEDKNIKYRIFDNLKNTDYIMNNTFWIGLFPGITKEMIRYIVKKFGEFFEDR